MIRGIITICAVLLLAPLVLACAGGPLLPGESTASPDRPGKSSKPKSKGLIGDRKAGIESHKKGGTGQAWEGPGAHRSDSGNVIIERRKKASFGAEEQRDGELIKIKSGEPTGGQSGELGGGSSTKPRKKEDEERDAGRRATLLSGSEGIRDKLGRSGRRGPGKSLG